MATRVVVIGLDLPGLIAGWVFRQHPHVDVVQVGGLRAKSEVPELVPHTECVGTLLRELGVPYASYCPQDAMLLRGKLMRYPSQLRGIENPQHAINAWAFKAGYDPMSERAMARLLSRRGPALRRRLRFATPDFVEALSRDANINPCANWRLEPGCMMTSGQRVPFDFAVCTEPLWALCSRVWFDVPEPRYWTDEVFEVAARSMQALRRFDRVLTPFTPGQAVFDLIEHGSHFFARASANARRENVLSDLNFLFPDGYAVLGRTKHCGRLDDAPRMRWPEHVQPLGCLAQWNRSIGLDAVIDGAYNLMRRWL